MAVTGVVVRRRVADLDAAIKFYEVLTGESAHRFGFGEAQLAAIGPFLIFTADAETGDRLERVIATVTVDDLDAHLALLDSLGVRSHRARQDTERAPPDRPPSRRRRLRVHGRDRRAARVTLVAVNAQPIGYGSSGRPAC